MTWEARRNTRYYYSAVKEGGRVIKSYIGTGVAGALAAEIDAAERVDRQRQYQRKRDLREQLEQADQVMAAVDRSITLLTKAMLLIAGYHMHRKGKWHRTRRKSMALLQSSNNTPTTANDTLADFVERSQRGDQTAMSGLRAIVDRTDTWQSVAGLAENTEDFWIVAIAGDNMPFAESLHNELEAMRAKLRGQGPVSQSEKLIIQVITMSWLQLQHANIALAIGQHKNLRSLERRQAQATRRHLAAIKELATLRRLLRPAKKDRTSRQPSAGKPEAPSTTTRIDTGG